MSASNKISVIREAILNRLKELYGDQRTEFCKEAKLLEYLMCVIEADESNVDFAKACLIKAYE